MSDATHASIAPSPGRANGHANGDPDAMTQGLTNAHSPAFGLAPGPIEVVHAFWLAGMSCDGCSIAAVGAQSPSVEQLVSGSIPGLPREIGRAHV